MPTVSTGGTLGDFTSLRAARDSCDMNNYSLGRNAPNSQPCHTTSNKTSACLWLRLFGRSTRLNARQNCHPRWATAWTVWTVSQGWPIVPMLHCYGLSCPTFPSFCSATSGSIELLGGPVTGIGCGCGFAIGNCTPSRTVASRKSFPGRDPTIEL